MSDRRVVCPVAGLAALSIVAFSTTGDALVIARVTRHGYIVVDEPESPAPYGNVIPTGSTSDLLSFIADSASAIDQAGAPHGEYIAAMQTSFDRTSFAFYFGLINDTRGLGIQSPLGDRRETYDLNAMVGTPFPVTGFVFLNDLSIYVGPGGDSFTRRLVCSQEFGHHYGTFLRIPPTPGPMTGDAGDDAGPIADADSADGAADVATVDAPAPLPTDVLLGRQRAHWSYFVNSGGSPMEGNAWTEVSPGVFQTSAPSLSFSALDLYVMGLSPPSDVPPFFVIAEPDVGTRVDPSGMPLNRESPPEYARRVTIHGRRVTYTIDDVIRANGPRVPAYRSPDAGPDAGPSASPDLQVTWVLLAMPDEVTDRLAEDFDLAIEGCTIAYDDAAAGRSHLNSTMSDAGPGDAAADAAHDAARDVVDGAHADVHDENVLVPPPSNSGCGCSVDAGERATRGWRYAVGVLVLISLPRRRRARSPG